jgi:hypothetical protein
MLSGQLKATKKIATIVSGTGSIYLYLNQIYSACHLSQIMRVRSMLIELGSRNAEVEILQLWTVSTKSKGQRAKSKGQRAEGGRGQGA